MRTGGIIIGCILLALLSVAPEGLAQDIDTGDTNTYVPEGITDVTTNTGTMITQETKAGDVGGGGDTKRMLVKTFGVDFGLLSSADHMVAIQGNPVGNSGYISVEDGGLTRGRYVTIDVTDLTDGASKIIEDVMMNMRSYGGALAVTTLSGVPSKDILGVAQDVYMDGDLGYTIMERRDVSDGAVGVYGIIPEFILNVPAYSALGSYQGTIEISLYTN